MNATRWVAVAGYVRWLGDQGLCTIDQTEKGWYITLIDKDPETVRRQMETERKEKMTLDDSQRQAKLIAEQIKKDKESSHEPEAPVYTELVRTDAEEKVQVTFNKSIIAEKNKVLTPSLLLSTGKKRTIDENPDDESDSKKQKSDINESISVFKKPLPISSSSKSKTTALEELRRANEKMKEQKNRKDYWLHEGIIVKVITSKLGEKYNKKKKVSLLKSKITIKPLLKCSIQMIRFVSIKLISKLSFLLLAKNY